MLKIYVPQNSPRLQYVCDFIFKEQFGLEYTITAETVFPEEKSAVILYTVAQQNIPGFFIKATGLLWQDKIKQQEIDCFSIHGFKAFFKTAEADIEFDIFSAIFYLLSRYEEYLPYENDMYGRYAHENSLAFKEGFLHIPLINYWLHHFKVLLQKTFPALIFKETVFAFIPTYDIDIAYSYKGKGFLRNLGGFLQAPGRERIAVNLGQKIDPYDAYDYLHMLHKKYSLEPVYFFLLADKLSKYDKNLPPVRKRMQKLITQHDHKYDIGLHPSWESFNEKQILGNEMATLKEITCKQVNISRQHYIRYSLPETFQILSELGITDEYSMGYGSINGFRASVASSYNWYDLSKEENTNLRLHPFCFMDANSFFEEKLTAKDAYIQLQHYYHECKKVEGEFITIFHNNFLGTEKMFAGYREIYKQFIQEHFFVV